MSEQIYAALGRGNRKNRDVQSRPARTLYPACGAVVKFGNVIVFINVSIFSNFASILVAYFSTGTKEAYVE
jgi:hypothetical protein